MKALIIEDSKEIVDAVTMIFQLRWPRVEVIWTESGEKGVDMVEAEAPDIVILDIGLADIHGFEVLRQIRLFSDIPVIILTGLAINEIDKIKGFEMGADDYVVKPFTPAEFLARVKNALAHTRVTAGYGDASALTMGDLIIDFDNHCVSVGGNIVSLTPTEYRLLCYLARNVGRVARHENILQTVWGHEYNDTAIIKTCIYELRRKLTWAGATEGIIGCERGVGYRLVPETDNAVRSGATGNQDSGRQNGRRYEYISPSQA